MIKYEDKKWGRAYIHENKNGPNLLESLKPRSRDKYAKESGPQHDLIQWKTDLVQSVTKKAQF